MIITDNEPGVRVMFSWFHWDQFDIAIDG